MSAVVRHTVARHTVALLSVLSVLLSGSTSWANDIAVSSMSLGGQNTTSDFTMVRFNLSWDNSWRFDTGPANWDAAWVFVKFRVGGSNPTFTGATSSGTTVTVSSTANLRVGMPVRVTAGTGAFATNTVISSITNATQFVVSATPTTVLSNASIECVRIWEHAWLNNTGHTAPTGSTIDAGLQTPSQTFNASTNPALGVFVYRSAVSVGHNTFNNVQLRWNYGANGVADDAVISVQVFAIEMVYVPQGAFYVGSGGTGTSELYTHTTNVPYSISSEGQITVGTTSGNLYYASSTFGGDRGGPIPAAFPKGYNGFYCMKYEVAQGQYRDFLNTLTYQQQAARTAVSPASAAGTEALSNTNRNGLDIQTPGNATSLTPAVYACNLNVNTSYNESMDGEWIACNFLNWNDDCAYADWAGLRPMTELEFEKVCRGSLTPVANEYAWGTGAIPNAAYTLSNAGANNETINANYGATNASYGATDGDINGPLRTGIFAGAATNRLQSGASYYGAMEMSGNLQEWVVSIGNSTGRSFTGIHGNGELTTDGTADVNAWPGTNVVGAGLRGGAWNFGADLCRVSDRIYAAYGDATRYADHGFRAVRTAP